MMEHVGSPWEPAALAFWKKPRLAVFPAQQKVNLGLEIQLTWSFLPKNNWALTGARRGFVRSLASPSLADHTVCIISTVTYGILFQRLF